MARPVDAALRDRLLERIIDTLARFPLGGLSLRQLGTAVGVSPRTLLYHFDSRDGLLDAIVEGTSRRLAGAAAGIDGSLGDIVRASWAWMSAPERRGFLNVFYEVCALGVRDPVRRETVASSLFRDWYDMLVERGVPDESATLLIATLHGLLLDLALTGDRARVGRAFDSYVVRLSSQSKVEA